MMLARLSASALARSGVGARLSTLIFHRVRPETDLGAPLALDAAGFDRLLHWVSEVFTVLPVDEAVERLASDSLPARALTITFDDGYADNAEVALPILRRHGMCAAFFVASDYLDGGVMWNDQITLAMRGAPAGLFKFSGDELGVLGLADVELDNDRSRRQAAAAFIRKVKYLTPRLRTATVNALVDRAGVTMPGTLMMSSAQVRELRDAGMVVGGHTCSHPILSTLSDSQAEAEIANNKIILEELVGERLRLFAYPNGVPGRDYRAEHARMVERIGYQAAFSTAWGVAQRAHDPYQLARFTPWDRQRNPFLWRMVRNLLRQPQLA